MNPLNELAHHRIARAHEALDEANLLIEQRHFTGALNRLYYAAFYAARALLATNPTSAVVRSISAKSPCCYDGSCLFSTLAVRIGLNSD